MQKILTLVIPSYNMEDYLDQCLNSLIMDDQSLMESLEVLIVNDGSKDGTLAKALKYQNCYPFTFIVINKENGNYGSCINCGLSRATGKYIKVLDADDSFDKKTFSDFLLFLLAHDVDCVLSDMTKVKPDGTVAETVTLSLPIDRVFSLDDLGIVAQNMWMHCVCYKTENVRSIKYQQTEGISYTDQEWIFLPMSTSKHICYFNKTLYRYLVGRDGQTISTDVWEKNFWQEIKGTKVMMQERKILYPNCSESAKRYLDIRLNRRIENMYVAMFTKFKTGQNNDCFIEFDQYLKQYSGTLYLRQNQNRVAHFFYYVKYWRKTRRSNSLFLKLVRIIAESKRKV